RRPCHGGTAASPPILYRSANPPRSSASSPPRSTLHCSELQERLIPDQPAFPKQRAYVLPSTASTTQHPRAWLPPCRQCPSTSSSSQPASSSASASTGRWPNVPSR